MTLRGRNDGGIPRAHSGCMARRPALSAVLRLPLADVVHRLSPRVLREAGLGQCLGCAMAPFETVEEAARDLSLDPASLARRLEAALGGRKS